MQNQNSAPSPALLKIVGVKVKSVKKAGKANVYCLSAHKNRTMIANGIITGNCDALRYALYTHFFNKDGRSLSAQELDKMYNETRGIQADLPSFFQQPFDQGYRF